MGRHASQEYGTILSHMPMGQWLDADEIMRAVVNIEQNVLTRYLNILVSESRIERKYVFVEGQKRRKALFCKTKSELKVKMPKRRCLMCESFFIPNHKFNFICCRLNTASE